MLLHKFLETYNETNTKKKVRDYITSDHWGEAKGEFLGHFLSSVFQPILELKGNRLETVGFEAFVRTIEGSQEVSPTDYFEGLEIDKRAFVDRLCRDINIQNFTRQASQNEFISLNVQTEAMEEHIIEFDELRNSIAMAASMGLQTNRIVVELDLAPELDAGILYTFASQLREQGILIALSGFDADCASFNRVVQNKPDVVIFNRSWLNHGLHDHSFRKLLSEIVSSVSSLGTTAHFEQIETLGELRLALSCGFKRFQGYHLGKPETALRRPHMLPPGFLGLQA